MNTSTRRFLLMVSRSGGELTYHAAGKLGAARSRALSEAQAAGYMERTSNGYALNGYGRRELRRDA